VFAAPSFFFTARKENCRHTKIVSVQIMFRVYVAAFVVGGDGSGAKSDPNKRMEQLQKKFSSGVH
jgi:hypothetical protein